MQQILSGAPGAHVEFPSVGAVPWRRVILNNDSPNAVYVRFGGPATASAYDLVMRPRRGISWPMDPAAIVGFLVDPAGQQPAALDQVLCQVDDQDGPFASEWTIALSPGGTSATPVQLLGPDGLPIGSSTDPGSRQQTSANLQVGAADVAAGNPVPVSKAGWTWKKVTAGAAGAQQVKAAGGLVAEIITDAANGAGVTVNLQDGANQAWPLATGPSVQQLFPTDGLICTTNIQLNFSAAGNAWILYR